MQAAVSAIPLIKLREPQAPPLADARPNALVLRVLREEGAGVLRLLYRLLHSEADVMDAFQDCFCRLASLGDRPDPVRAKAYVYRTAGNVAIEQLRTRRRQSGHLERIGREKPTVVPAASEPDSRVEWKNEELQNAVARLPAHLRNVIVLRDLSGMSYEQVGQTLDIDPATARVYRRHAVVRLADLLGDKSRES